MKKTYKELIAVLIYMGVAILPAAVSLMGWIRLFTGKYHLFW